MNTIVATLFTVCLLFAKAYAAGDEDVFEWRPEIQHIFRDPDAMPSTWFSQAFTLITLSPWLVLLVGWLGIGVTPAKVVSELMAGPSLRMVSIIAFLASLGAIEYVFYLYWTRLNLFQTLPYLAGLVAITFITGQRALTQVQAKRLSSQ
ncbi:Dolichyl-diphosphooligosaccharide--protein glycosyltransferase subunit Swp1 [Syncephalastrum racemosum]|uniref:Dolichyl-diphosphooligosaccharide--protein glycosyltransferase subunit Swp1 n=1 Tax=Syncephalastrum racemosum TaxID=13706 RepID=A0A1X2HWQ9_SYNRA|nr:Dolichyl-diphosphooligosaccharide--protein glycosyltransferase subunit Swp1 [Syncephalastrum racemosum]